MAPTIRSVSTGEISWTSSSASVPEPAGMQSTDLLVAFQYTAKGTLAGLTAPAGFTLDGSHSTTDGTFQTNGKVWTSTGADAGSGPYSFGFTGGHDGATVTLICISDHDGLEASSTWGGVAASSPLEQTAPSVTATSSDGLLLCGWTSYAFNNVMSYTPPASMTEQSDIEPDTNYNCSATASEVLTASGATGTRTATPTRASYNVTTSLIVAPAAGGTAFPVADTDSAGLSDTAAIFAARGLLDADGVGLSDTDSTASQFRRNAIDAAGTGDFVALASGHGRGVTDQAGVGDSAQVVVAAASGQRIAGTVTLMRVAGNIGKVPLAGSVSMPRLAGQVTKTRLSGTASIVRLGGTVDYANRLVGGVSV